MVYIYLFYHHNINSIYGKIYLVIGSNSYMHFKIKTIKDHKYLYIIKNDRIDGKIVQSIQKCAGTADKVYELITSNKSVRIASYSFGKPAALIKAATEVGLIESINRRIDRKKIDGLTAAQYLLLIIIGRSEHELSRNVLEGYFKKSALRYIWKPKYKLSSQNFLNYMELGLRPTRLSSTRLISTLTSIMAGSCLKKET